MLIPCLRCKRFYRCKHVGHAFEEGMPGHAIDAPAGTTTEWRPYKLWIGDLYECEGCGAQTVLGMARAPLAEHYQPVYAEKADRYRTQIDGLVRIDDCPGSFSQERADILQGAGHHGPPRTYEPTPSGHSITRTHEERRRPDPWAHAAEDLDE